MSPRKIMILGLIWCLTLCCIRWVTVQILNPRSLTPTSTTSVILSASANSGDEPDYDKAFQNLLKEEGGYSEDADDPGGATKYGISSRSYPHLNISSLTLDQAKKIYFKDFWSPLLLPQFKSHIIASEMLEQSVNMGSKRAVTQLQTCAVGGGHSIAIDGDMGKKTLQAVNDMDQHALLLCIKSQALSYYRDLSFRNASFKKYLKGWFQRVLT